MTTNVAINGFGRIGRLALRGMLERHKQELSVVAVNDMADLHTNAHLFRYDSTWTERWPKCFAWYDNEWGYSCRVGDLATLMAERELYWSSAGQDRMLGNWS